MSNQTCGLGAMIVAAIGFLLPSVAAAQCAGDCDGDGDVQVAEVITCVNVSLNTLPLTRCNPCDVNGDDVVTIDELITVVRRALGYEYDCPTPTPTDNEVTRTPDPPACALEAGEYRLMQRASGELRVATFSPWPVPDGGTITLEVDEAEQGCRHAVSVPFPGGLELPTFCVPGTGYSVQLTQAGCGVGQIVSTDRVGYSVTTAADTSDTSGVCSTPESTCPLGSTGDGAARVHVSVAAGDAGCAADQPVDILVTIPIRLLIWADSEYACPGTFDPDEDSLIGDWPMVWDLTTGTATGYFADLDGDGCWITGTGPIGGFARTGTCFDASARNDVEATAVVVAAGAAAVGPPIFDMTFALTMPASLTGPTGRPAPVSPCPSAPRIDFAGAVDRCLPD
jgi:hypothetical protein